MTAASELATRTMSSDGLGSHVASLEAEPRSVHSTAKAVLRPNVTAVCKLAS